MINSDSIRRFLALRQKLEAEKVSLEARLTAVTNALGHLATSPSPAVTKTPSTAAPAARSGRGQNAFSLRTLVVEATAAQPLTKEEILAAVAKRGYKFEAKVPVNSLNSVLYGKNPKFINRGGKFSPVGAAKSAEKASGAEASKGKRKMSAQGRAKIRAALKARWAKYRLAKAKPQPKS